MQFIDNRETLDKWGETMTREGRNKLDKYQDKNNAHSLDGLPGLKSARSRLGQSVMLDEVKRWVRNVWYGKLDAVLLGWLIGVVIAILNEIFNRYGEDIKAGVTKMVHRN